ncbi:MAG TPA: hypothetical protein VMA98_06140 [Candidatus Acidoferrales bacterium]|nr:hypothetical protein [Candidatus Acidoferrales bacterium]
MVGLLLAAGLAAGTYTYTATIAGTNVGTSTLTVKNIGTTTEIDEHATGAISGESASANATLILGPDLGPLTYQLNATNDGSPIKDSATIQNSTANITNVHGQSQSFDLLGSTKHFVVVDLGTFAGFFPLPAQMRAWDDVAVLAVVPSLGQTVTLVPDATAATRPSTVPAADLPISFSGQAPFTIWYDPTTNVPDEIDVTAQGLVVTRNR